MEATLDRIQNITKTGVGLNSVSNQVKKIAEAAQKLSEGGIKKMSNLATALDRFSRLGDVKISANVGRQIGSIADAALKLQAADLSKITVLADSLRPFSTMGNAHLTSYVNQFGKMPQVIRELNAADLDKFIANIKELNTALTPFANNMQKISNGFSAFPSRIQRLVTSTEKYNSTMSKANKITAAGKSNGLWGFLNSAHSKYLLLAGVFGMVSNTLGGFVDKSASYSENLNLFTVAMGKCAEEATDYAKSVQAALGIDMSEWMRNQGIFMQIATGFGVIEEKAYTMSQGLTQIAYDIASFYNISTEEAMQKVQSGISGELEPLRRLGYALDAATLQQVAYDNGIRQNINTMTQAQKSQLRYVAIMEQSTNVMGDMSRTIMSPANALRVMNMQLEQLQRALGNAILPLLMKILPYVQAVVVVLTDAINKLAVMFGFELPKIDYSGLEGLKSGAEDADDSLSGAAKAAKELKNATLGLDELNVISPNSGTGTGTSGGYDLPLDIESYKFFDENYKNVVSEIADELRNFFEGLTPLAEGFVHVLDRLFSILPGFDDGGLSEWFRDMGNWFEEHPDVLEKIGEGLAVISLGWAAISGLTNIGNSFAIISQGLGSIATAAGSAKGALGLFKGLLSVITSPIGLVIGGLALLSGAILLIADNWDTIKEKWGSTGAKVMERIEDKTKDLGEAFVSLWEDKIKPVWGMISESVSEIWENHISPLWDNIKAFGQGLAEIALLVYDNFILPLATFIGKYVLPAFVDYLGATFKIVWNFLEDTIDVVSGLVKAWTGFTTFLSGVFTLDFTKAWDGIKMYFSGAWDTFKSIAGAGVNAIIGVINRFITSAANGLNMVIDAINSINVTIPDWVPLVGGKTFGPNIPNIRAYQIPTFASGGYPDEGSLFIARERGAEMVGSIGGRTAVANNDQIVEAIQRGVYEAEMAARSQGGGDTYVYIDSDEVSSRIEKRKRESGMSIFAGGVVR